MLFVAAIGSRRGSGELERCLSDLIPVVDRGMKRVRSSQVFYAVALLLCLSALVFTSDLSVPYGLEVIVSIARVVLVVYAAFCAWMAGVLSHWELNVLMAAKKDANNTLRTLPAFK